MTWCLYFFTDRLGLVDKKEQEEKEEVKMSNPDGREQKEHRGKMDVSHRREEELETSRERREQGDNKGEMLKPEEKVQEMRRDQEVKKEDREKLADEREQEERTEDDTKEKVEAETFKVGFQSKKVVQQINEIDVSQLWEETGSSPAGLQGGGFISNQGCGWPGH